MQIKRKTPLSFEQTSKVLADLKQDLHSERITEITKKIERGEAFEEEARLLLAAFCARATEVREVMHDASNTPAIIEFVASRLAMFLSGIAPDLYRALGLKRKTRGRKPKFQTQEKEIQIAAMVMEQMDTDKRTLEKAVADVAEKEGIHESTVRNWYSKNKQAAKMLCTYRYLLLAPKD